jgi:hypothetical protein
MREGLGLPRYCPCETRAAGPRPQRALQLVRIQRTLRCTPAMAAGVADRLWSVDELIVGALADQGAAQLSA